MPVPTEVSRIEYTGNAATDTFPVPFPFFEDEHLVVKLLLISDDSETIETLDVDYTVNGAGEDTGEVVFDTPPSALVKVRIERTVPIVQGVDFRDEGDFSAESHTQVNDYGRQIDQQTDRRIADLEGLGDTGDLAAGNGLTKSSNTLHVGAGTGIQVNANDVQVLYGAAPANVTKSAASAGAANTAARSDHKHDVTTAVAGAAAIGDAAAEGTATSLARSDHKHSFAAPAAPANITKATAAAGTATTFARSDHKHDVSTAAPVELTNNTNGEGNATTIARSNHTHAHGARGGGTLHAEATSGAAGFMPSTAVVQLAALVADSPDTPAISLEDQNIDVSDPFTIATIAIADRSVVHIEVDVIGLIDQALSADVNGCFLRSAATFRNNGVDATAQCGATAKLLEQQLGVSAADLDFEVSGDNVHVIFTPSDEQNMRIRATGTVTVLEDEVAP